MMFSNQIENLETLGAPVIVSLIVKHYTNHVNNYTALT